MEYYAGDYSNIAASISKIELIFFYFKNAYGTTLGGLVYLPSCLGDVCWTAAVLSALGSTLAVILQAIQILIKVKTRDGF